MMHLISFILCVYFLIDCTYQQLSSSPLDPPISRDPNDVGFYLYKNPEDVNDADELVYLNSTSITNSRYNISNPVILMCHGFTQSYLSQFPYYVKLAYLLAGYAAYTNIIAVDWSKLSGQYNGTILASAIAELPSYINARNNVNVVGKRIAQFLVFLIENNLLSGPNQIHLVGQSLGAHASGMAGYYFQNITSTSIYRITGTDPAGPLFQNYPTDDRLDPTDAIFVDVVHTNEGEFGYHGSLGKVDFYVNGGGPIQPACIANVDLFCSHNLAPRYFAKSIPTSQILACQLPIVLLPCLSTQIFGEHCPSTANGNYYLNMNFQ